MSRRNAWLTPSVSLPVGTACYTIAVPDNEELRRIITGALSLLVDPNNYEQFGTLSPIETSEQFRKTLKSFIFQTSECEMIGAVFPYVGNAPPPKLLPCDGTTYQRVDYPLLYEYLIGTALIINADSFKTPSLEGRFLRGADTTNPTNSIGGSDTKIIDLSNMPTHHHDYYGVVMNVDIESVGVPDPVGAGINPFPDPTSDVGGGQPMDILPSYYSVSYGIVAK